MKRLNFYMAIAMMHFFPENEGGVGTPKDQSTVNNTVDNMLEVTLVPGTYNVADVYAVAVAAGYAGTMTKVAKIEIEGTVADANDVSFTTATNGMTAVEYGAGGKRAFGESAADAGGDLRELDEVLSFVVPATAEAIARITVF
jgi:hypothetical protein